MMWNGRNGNALSGAALTEARHPAFYAPMTKMPDPVKAVFETFPKSERVRLSKTRKLLFSITKSSETGPLTETLKWGQPSYLTEVTGAGSTVRLGLYKGQAAVFFNCQTTLVESFRADFPEAFSYVGNRTVLLDAASDEQALGICLARALTYHRDKRRRA